MIRKRRHTYEDDCRLVARIQNGDERAGFQLVNQYRGLVYVILKQHRVKNADDMDDIIQHVWIRLFKYLPRWAPENGARLTTLIGKIAETLALQYLRNRSRRKAYITDEWGDGCRQPGFKHDSQPAPEFSRPDKQYEFNERVEQLFEQLGDPQSRAVAYLVAVEGLSRQEIGRKMCISPRQVSYIMGCYREDVRIALEKENW